jgi:hypothetical protein
MAISFCGEYVRKAMNRQLAKAIVAAFRDGEIETIRGGFAHFDESDWTSTTEWLHTSGLALYFLARAKALGIEDVIPMKTVRGLEANYEENRARTADMFSEFVRINMEFQRAKLSYANLKGFSLAPSACADFACRYQHDLDFLVARRDAERCRQAVERNGYRLAAEFGDTLEFRSGPAEVLSMRDLYKAKTQRSLEVHLISEAEQNETVRSGNRLSRLQLQLWNDFEFPALSECDKLIAQALHLFKHFQTEWTRTAWMLEYATAIRSHRRDVSFWQDVVTAVANAPETRTGIGLATLITNRAFGAQPPDDFVSCTVDVLPRQVRLWANRYQADLVFVERPGSKLYLLLKDALLQDQPDWQVQKLRKLFPMRLPPQETRASQNDGIWLRAKLFDARIRFIWSRLHFHVTAGLHYWIEAARWKRVVADLHS